MKSDIERVQADWREIMYMDNPSPQVQLTAVREDPSAIGYILDPTPEVQMASIRQDPETIEYITNPTPQAVALAKKLKERESMNTNSRIEVDQRRTMKEHTLRRIEQSDKSKCFWGSLIGAVIFLYLFGWLIGFVSFFILWSTTKKQVDKKLRRLRRQYRVIK